MSERETAPVCECDMRTKLVGDGCYICNPEYYEEMMKPEEDDPK